MLPDEEYEAYLEELGRVFEEYRDDEEADLDDLFLRYPTLETIEHWFKAFDSKEEEFDEEEEEE
jgi:hypothetical protein